MRLPKVSPRLLRIQIAAVAVAIVLAMLWFAARTAQEGQKADERGLQRDAAVGAAESVIDCINDPATRDTAECEAEAEDAQETLAEEVPPVGLTARQRREVVLIAAELIASDPSLSESEIVAAVLARLPEPESGKRGRAGEAGEPGAEGGDGQDGIDAETPSTAEIRALVESVYEANPPSPGADGMNGTNGADGRAGPRGLSCVEELGLEDCRGPAGPVGPAGADSNVPGPAGADSTVPGPKGDPGDKGEAGAPGRGVTSISCDSLTPFTLTVTYSDGTTATVSCGGVQ